MRRGDPAVAQRARVGPAAIRIASQHVAPPPQRAAQAPRRKCRQVLPHNRQSRRRATARKSAAARPASAPDCTAEAMPAPVTGLVRPAASPASSTAVRPRRPTDRKRPPTGMAPPGESKCSRANATLVRELLAKRGEQRLEQFSRLDGDAETDIRDRALGKQPRIAAAIIGAQKNVGRIMRQYERHRDLPRIDKVAVDLPDRHADAGVRAVGANQDTRPQPGAGRKSLPCRRRRSDITVSPYRQSAPFHAASCASMRSKAPRSIMRP